MVKRLFFFALLAMAGVFGWVLGFLRWPLAEGHHTFWVGLFVGGSAVLALHLLRLVVRHRRAAKRASAASRFWQMREPVLLIMLVVALTWLSIVSFHQQRQLTKVSARYQTNEQHQQGLMQAERSRGLAALIAPLLSDMRAELTSDAQGKLSASLLRRVQQLSSSLKPYPVGDQGRWLSPERGQLLVGLLAIPMHPDAWSAICQEVTFAHADLAGLDLRGAPLAGADLEAASLDEADLRHANLSGAGLQRATLWRARLDSANLVRANLFEVQMNWAGLAGSTLDFANLNGAKAEVAVFRRASMYRTTLQWSEMAGAQFEQAYLVEADLLQADLGKANLRNADLRLGRLRKARLSGADLVGARLDSIAVGKDWMQQVSKWQFTGYESVKRRYVVVPGAFPPYDQERFVVTAAPE